MNPWARAFRVLPAVALALISWTLVLTAGFGLEAFFERSADRNTGVRAETVGHATDGRIALAELACIQRVIAASTKPGEAVRLQTGTDEYLLQRVAELMYPRVDLTADRTAPIVSVLPRPPGSPDARCGGVAIDIEPAQ